MALEHPIALNPSRVGTGMMFRVPDNAEKPSSPRPQDLSDPHPPFPLNLRANRGEGGAFFVQPKQSRLVHALSDTSLCAQVRLGETEPNCISLRCLARTITPFQAPRHGSGGSRGGVACVTSKVPVLKFR